VARDSELSYIRYNIGDIVKERQWVSVNTEPLYGIIVYLKRLTYTDNSWIEFDDDALHVYWFRWNQVEVLPACMVEIVSSITQTEEPIIGNRNE
tara:strand:+ start:8293 stop:8574 length:282 start_codon:yes stop_codon:yes gene_type:complete